MFSMGIENLVKQLNKKEGKNVISKANEILELPRCSTGSLALDVEMGGGIPLGRIISLTGLQSSGKSILAMKMVAEFQKKYPNQDILWIDAEGAWDPTWAATIGVDMSPGVIPYVMRPEYMEQAYNTTLLAVDENVGLVVIDSLAALSPKAEMEEDIEKWSVGLAARLNRKLMRKFQGTVNDSNFTVPSTLIYINHLNVKIGASTMPGMPPPTEEPGGKALQFFPSIKINIRKGGVYPKPKAGHDEIQPKAQEIKFHIEKNKTAPPLRRGHFWFYFDTLDAYRPKGGYDRLEEVIRYAKKFDIIGQRGSIFDLIDADTGEVTSFKGSNALAEHIRGNPDVREGIERRVANRVEGEMVASGVPKDEEVLGTGDKQEKGTESSEGNEGKESIGVGSDSVGERGHSNGTVSDPAQIDLESITLD